MKKVSLLMLFVCTSFLIASAQNTQSAKGVSFAKIDASPLDVVYFPLNTTKAKEPVTPIMRVLYSRPQKKGREIFGVLEQFGKIWRLGANESTELELFTSVKINGKKVKAGRYSAFVIPNKEMWTFILNKQTDKWGSFSYNERNDVLRMDIPVTKLEQPLENFSISFDANEQGADLIMAWDKSQAALPIQFKK